MANAINQPLPGYPCTIGSKTLTVFDHYGPSSYVQYNASTGVGDIVNASDLGFGGLDQLDIFFTGYSNSGNYIVWVMMTKANATPAAGAGTRVTLQWLTTSSAFGPISTQASATANLN